MTRAAVAACALLALGSIMRPAAARTDNIFADVSRSDTVRVAPPTSVRDKDRSSILLLPVLRSERANSR